MQGMEDLLDGRLDCGSDALSDASQVGDWIVAVLPLLVPLIHLPAKLITIYVSLELGRNAS